MEVKPLKDLQKIMHDDPKNHTLTKKYLTDDIVKKYASTKTKFGGSLAQCVNTNAVHPENNSVPRACDQDAYTTFNEFFDPVIKEYHKVKGDKISHPKSDFGHFDNLNLTDFDKEFGKKVVSTRIRVGRTVEGYGFGPTLTKEDRIKLEETIVAALNSLSGEYAGTYESLSKISDAEQKRLINDHLLFRADDEALKAAGGLIDWPVGRGIFMNMRRKFIVWVNEEDHIRIIALQSGGDLLAVYKRLAGAVEELSKHLKFATNDRLGFLAFCPSNLGTAMRASVLVKLPLLSSMPNFKEICESHGLGVRGTHGEHSEGVDGVYDISNKRRLGLNENDLLREMHTGVWELLKLEAAMEDYNRGAPEGTMPIEPLPYLAKLLERSSMEKSHTRKCLTQEIIKKYDGVRTKHGATVAHMIRNCAYNPVSICPRTGEAECYIKFIDYLDSVIMSYHNVKEANFKHPSPDFGDLNNLPFGDVDPSGKYVVSTRVRVGRSIDGHLFPPIMGKKERIDLEKMISAALGQLQGEHKGTYYPLTGMNETVRKQLVDDHFLFKNDDPVLRDAGGYRDWPAGRGIFHNNSKTFLVWVCEEDHMRIISMQKGGNLAEVYKRLILGIKAIETKLKFAHSDKYGYVTCCPSNLGTTMRASVLVKIPKLMAHKDKLDEICKQHMLQARGLYGEHTESPDGTFDISNRRRLGLTELQAAKEMADGVVKVIELEKKLGG